MCCYAALSSGDYLKQLERLGPFHTRLALTSFSQAAPGVWSSAASPVDSRAQLSHSAARANTSFSPQSSYLECLCSRIGGHSCAQ